ncbi:MAG: 3-hydroxyacyl-ACP dehydratase [Caulobacter sp.]|nr:3-hydroxyacyl-ACP dehydratase [Caulobacter sp.]
MTDYPPIDRLVPHRRPMQLVDRVIAEEGEITRAEHTIGPDHVFLVPGKGVPTYAGFEMMAQSICATDGLKRWRSDRPAALGFLLGCRKFPASRDWLQVGETLTIESRQLLEGETASYECRLLDAAGAEISTAVVNVFQPADITQYLKGVQP